MHVAPGCCRSPGAFAQVTAHGADLTATCSVQCTNGVQCKWTSLYGMVTTWVECRRTCKKTKKDQTLVHFRTKAQCILSPRLLPICGSDVTHLDITAKFLYFSNIKIKRHNDLFSCNQNAVLLIAVRYSSINEMQGFWSCRSRFLN